MRGTPTMTPVQSILALLDEADQYAPGSEERAWRIRSAWTLDQIDRRIPCVEWTPPPAWFGPGYQIEEAA